MRAEHQPGPRPGDLTWEQRTPELSAYVDQLRADGVGALFDLTGTSDRARAREELAPRFQRVANPTGSEQDAVEDAVRMLEEATIDRRAERPDARTTFEVLAKTTPARARILEAYQRKWGFSLDDRLRSQNLNEDHSLLRPGGRLDTRNVVTERGFDELVQFYSDIRMDRAGLRIDTDGLDPGAAARYRAATMDDIGSLMQTPMGRRLLDAVGRDEQRRIALAPARGGRPHAVVPGSRGPRDRLLGGETQGVVRYDSGVGYMAGDGYPVRSDALLAHELVHEHDLLVSREGDSSFATPLTPGDAISASHGCPIRNIEYQATGVGPYADRAFSEARYVRERIEIGRSGVGERTDFVRDGEMVPPVDYAALVDVYGHFIDMGTPHVPAKCR